MRRLLILLGLLLLITGCRQRSTEIPRKLEFDAFVPVYNRYIEDWLHTQQTITAKEITQVLANSSTAVGDAKVALENRLQTLRLKQTKLKFRVDLGSYLKIGTPAEVPTNLVWENGMDQPEIGDPAATKGGALRRFIPSFPPTLRPFGDNSNNFFRDNLYDSIDLTLVNLHPETMKLIPGLAREWASSADGRTIYFHLDPEARYSDGIQVKAKDFLISVYLRVSDNLVNPYAKQYFRENIAQIAMYDDFTISVSLPEAKIYAPLIAGSIPPSAPHFYAEYGPDYNERYQWRFPPTTGAYEVGPEDLIKGASITQTRVKN